jgi:hypothetical protein
MVGFVVVCVVALGVVVYRTFFTPEARAKRALGGRPRALIGKSQGGEVHLVGRAHARGELLTAPVSRRPCLAYQLAIDVHRGRSWSRALDLADVRPFRVTDDTGEALVETATPTVLALEYDRSGSTGFFEDIDEASLNIIKDLLEANGIETVTWIGTAKNLRYREGVLEEGETVSVGGAAARELDLKASPSGPRSLPVSFVVRGTGAVPLIISDDPEAHGNAQA